jgi:hypothetical protein
MTSEQPRAGQSRADRFARELADLKISDPAAGHPRLWQRLGAAAMALGIAAGVTAYLVSHRTTSSLTQGDAITIGLGGVTLSVVGGVIFLRYSLTGFLRFWMARQSFELNVLAERAFSGSQQLSQREQVGPVPATVDRRGAVVAGDQARPA